MRRLMLESFEATVGTEATLSFRLCITGQSWLRMQATCTNCPATIDVSLRQVAWLLLSWRRRTEGSRR